jgi:hypothetical protein
LKLKKLFVAEIASVAIVLVVVLFSVEVIPYLASSATDSQIGIYNQKEYAKDTVFLTLGQTATAQFNYSTYDPAILVVDLAFQSWEIPGYMTLYCNGRIIATFLASPNNPTVRFTTISVSGWDWVKPPSNNALTYGNEVTFVSESESGYEGTFSYDIGIRGSR